jgi:predicted nucleotidyltransferase
MAKVVKKGYVLRDRDYICDTKGNYLKVLGDNHPSNKLVSYVKYFPSRIPSRKIGKRNYGYNSFVSKSFVILSKDEGRIGYSPFHGGIVTLTPSNDIGKVFSAQKKIQTILRNKEYYNKQKVGKELIIFLQAIENDVNLNNVGITGSFLIDAETDASDIDLVCYGKDTYRDLKKIFRDKKYINEYKGEFAKRLYKRRMIHMESMDFSKFILQENRKLQGLSLKEDVHINCQPLRDDSNEFFDKIEFDEIGEIDCIAEVVQDKESIYSPAYYGIEVKHIIDSLFDSGEQSRKNIVALLSFIGTYAGCFKKGETLFIRGKLVRMNNFQKGKYAIEVSPWNTRRSFTAKLI